MEDTATGIVARQLKAEIESIEMGILDYKANRCKYVSNKSLDTTQLSPENQLLHACIEPTVRKLGDTVKPIKKGQGNRGKRVTVRSNLTTLKIGDTLSEIKNLHELAFLTVRHLLQIPFSAGITSTCVQLGATIEKHIEYCRLRKEHPGLLKIVEGRLKTSNQSHRSRVMTFTKNKKGIQSLGWDENYKLHVGQFLIDACIAATKLWQIRYDHSETKVTQHNGDATICKSTKLETFVEACHEKCAILQPKLQPMLCPPKPWTELEDGGYLSGDVNGNLQMSFIKTRKKQLKRYYREHDLSRIFKVVNALQDTPWRINKKVLEVLEEASKTGLGELPNPNREENLPAKFWATSEEFDQLKEEEPDRIKAWKRASAMAHDEWFREKSKRTALLQKLRIARDFKDEESIYFIWVLDYRGRIYPVQPHVNPQSDDPGKALLEFAKGKPLGQAGAYWLAVAGAGHYGEDKITFDERVQWVKDHQEAILDSAENPLDGQRFWAKADKPFNFLAFCFEWAGYLREGESFVSHFPVQMDGACSGLQHFSGLLRDEIGGKAVALMPGEKPSDVYADVAVVVNQILDEEIAKGGKESELAVAWKVAGVDRSVTKRNVMTYAYSATLRGFADQLCDFIRKQRSKKGSYLGEVDDMKAATYLAKINHRAISTVLVKAVEAMEFFQQLTKVAIEGNILMRWMTPMGFPVWQEYLKSKTKQVKTFWGGIKIVQLSENGTDEVLEASQDGKKVILKPRFREDTKKADLVGSVNGISPNFIHSNDAAHLMLTVERCEETGKDFSYSMIHDSFGAHACDIPILNGELRRAFVDIYSGNLLEKFAKEVIEQLPEEARAALPPVPTQGSLDLNVVRSSAYFFC